MVRYSVCKNTIGEKFFDEKIFEKVKFKSMGFKVTRAIFLVWKLFVCIKKLLIGSIAINHLKAQNCRNQMEIPKHYTPFGWFSKIQKKRSNSRNTYQFSPSFLCISFGVIVDRRKDHPFQTDIIVCPWTPCGVQYFPSLINIHTLLSWLYVHYTCFKCFDFSLSLFINSKNLWNTLSRCYCLYRWFRSSTIYEQAYGTR